MTVAEPVDAGGGS